MPNWHNMQYQGNQRRETNRIAVIKIPMAAREMGKIRDGQLELEEGCLELTRESL